jgi:predicted DCC family thiol-disulfide oxidoreductase YuxK
VAAPVAERAPSVVLYDGVCGLCNRYVQFVLARDRRGRFQFAPLQGPFAARALARHGLVAPDVPDSIVLLEAAGTPAERARLRSDAVLRIVAQLGGAWRLATVLRVIPGFLRDAVYAVVARIRYRIFGRLDSCAVPPPSARGRFLE